MGNEGEIKRLLGEDKLKNIALQKAISGNNEANTNVKNIFMPLDYTSLTASNLVSSYLEMFSLLIKNKEFFHENKAYILAKIETYESLMLKVVKDEERFRNQLIELLEDTSS
ncbi:hypothetical protein [Halalkalibacter akibai]|uniref:Uncharacterized protein n=1 Tax=Halalkalibacter akibai (strain ATCC 43226 / DSM 21942 / CIP 109018 / JCM 9157 / 1139) TaxID=1236973 RepID=W4QZN0_HALA3|nr:hypothetical protein [Halalkalibacter akibai]GAE37526.1 hypothetical protein JCM9157_4835 [Halalkalibacter akibai JCM 9157]